jgi:hypothetical protein
MDPCHVLEPCPSFWNHVHLLEPFISWIISWRYTSFHTWFTSIIFLSCSTIIVQHLETFYISSISPPILHLLSSPYSEYFIKNPSPLITFISSLILLILSFFYVSCPSLFLPTPYLSFSTSHSSNTYNFSLTFPHPSLSLLLSSTLLSSPLNPPLLHTSFFFLVCFYQSIGLILSLTSLTSFTPPTRDLH